jgi:hypothetical protein
VLRGEQPASRLAPEDLQRAPEWIDEPGVRHALAPGPSVHRPTRTPPAVPEGPFFEMIPPWRHDGSARSR